MYVCDRFPLGVSSAPKLQALAMCRTHDPDGSASGGVPAIIGNVESIDGALPAVVPEITRIATTIGAKHPTSTRPTKAETLRLICTAPVIHFACHGAFNADDPLSSYLALDDGALTAREILDCTVHADLVILNACMSGRSKVEGADEVLGLVRAFLSAGTSTVVNTYWKVSDVVAGCVMPLFYRLLRLEGVDKLSALSCAIQILRQIGRVAALISASEACSRTKDVGVFSGLVHSALREVNPKPRGIEMTTQKYTQLVEEEVIWAFELASGQLGADPIQLLSMFDHPAHWGAFGLTGDFGPSVLAR